MHADRCEACGGLWVGGKCVNCQALCMCYICKKVRAELVKVFGTTEPSPPGPKKPKVSSLN